MHPICHIRLQQGEYFFDPVTCASSAATHISEKNKSGVICETYSFPLACNANLQAELLVETDPALGVAKCTPAFQNRSSQPVRVYRLDAGISIFGKGAELRYYSSDWGSEFTPVQTNLSQSFSFGTNSGRSCKGCDPWAGLVSPDGCTAVALGWSGNWTCSAGPAQDPAQGEINLFMGIGDAGFFVDVAPDSSFQGAAIYISGADSMESACLQIRRYFCRHLSLLSWDKGFSMPRLPMEFNTWWPYEDKYINEAVYQENVTTAKEVGLSYAMMDAGWFGGNENGQSWVDKRGDWEIVNQKDFPSGMKALCDKAKGIGIHPGMWCEIEAVGPKALLNSTHPEIIARRDGESLGYLCFSSEAARAWAMGAVDKILGEYGAKWIKFDFNLDPGQGCNCLDHGHGAGDGLYAHYMGYYRFLDEIHQKYPDVILENCASGGLRMDIEMLSHAHLTHISDPDFTEFHLQVYWGALSYLHQSACLHFSWSQTLGSHNLNVSNPISQDMPRYQFDMQIRAVLMGVPGFSYRLPDMPAWCRERLRELGEFYASISTDFILNGDAYRLTPQPLAGGKGERYPAFEFVSPEGEALVFAFRLTGAPEETTVKLYGLDNNVCYTVAYTDSGLTQRHTGAELAQNGIWFSGLPEEASEIAHICRVQ